MEDRERVPIVALWAREAELIVGHSPLRDGGDSPAPPHVRNGGIGPQATLPQEGLVVPGEVLLVVIDRSCPRSIMLALATAAAEAHPKATAKASFFFMTKSLLSGVSSPRKSSQARVNPVKEGRVAHK